MLIIPFNFVKKIKRTSKNKMKDVLNLRKEISHVMEKKFHISTMIILAAVIIVIGSSLIYITGIQTGMEMKLDSKIISDYNEVQSEIEKHENKKPILVEEYYVKELVKKGILLYDSIGSVEAFKQISDSNGEFIEGEKYLFVLSTDGIIKAHPAFPNLIGINRTNNVDIDGYSYSNAILNMATEKGAWIRYKFENPVSGQIENKKIWAVRNNDYIFAWSIYGEDVERLEAEEIQAKEFVKQGIILFNKYGKEKSFEIFNNPENGFVKGEQYLFVINTDGIIEVHTVFPNLIGNDYSNFIDQDNYNVGSAILNIVTEKGAWIRYKFENPVSGQIENKKIWAVRNNDYIFAWSIYGEDVERLEAEEIQAKEFVKQGIILFNKYGKEKSFEIFNNPENGFVKGEQYLFVEDYNGFTRVIPAFPQYIDVDFSEYRDSDGLLVQEIIQKAATINGGWAYYKFDNPSGDIGQKKSWVVKRGDYIFGSGVYIGPA